jgi:hypothetical protein
VKEWHVLQRLCPGIPGYEDPSHEFHNDPLPCPGGEWRDFMSLEWFSEPGRQREALDIVLEDHDDPENWRMVKRTETVLDL